MRADTDDQGSFLHRVRAARNDSHRERQQVCGTSRGSRDPRIVLHPGHGPEGSQLPGLHHGSLDGDQEVSRVGCRSGSCSGSSLCSLCTSRGSLLQLVSRSHDLGKNKDPGEFARRGFFVDAYRNRKCQPQKNTDGTQINANFRLISTRRKPASLPSEINITEASSFYCKL